MTDTQHTKTPYEIDMLQGKCEIISRSDEVVIGQVFAVNQEANAHFIVKACNYHDRLVGGLKECIAYFRDEIVTAGLNGDKLPYFKEYKNAVLLLSELDKDGE